MWRQIGFDLLRSGMRFFCKAKMSQCLLAWIQCWLFWARFNSLNRHYGLHLVCRKLQHKSRRGCGLGLRQGVKWVLGLRKAEVILIVKRSEWQAWLITECEAGAKECWMEYLCLGQMEMVGCYWEGWELLVPTTTIGLHSPFRQRCSGSLFWSCGS